MVQLKQLLLKFTDKKSNYNKSIVYVAADILNKILPFLMLPIITHYLKPADYGTLSVIESIIGFLAVFVGLGSQDLIQVYFFKKEKPELKRFVGNSILVSLSLSALFVIIFTIFSGYFESLFHIQTIWLWYSVLITLCMFIIKLCTTIFIAQGKSLLFGKFQNLNTFTILATTILFIVVLEWNWQGRVYSLVLSGIVFTFYSLRYLAINDLMEFKINFSLFLKDLRASIPVLPYSLSFWLSNSALLLIMATLIGKEQTGIYSGAMRIALIISFITITLNRIWQPMIYELLSKNSRELEFTVVKRTYLYILVIILFGGALFLFADFLIQIALDSAYHEAKDFAEILIITVVLQSVFSAPGGFLLYYEKKRLLTFITMFSIFVQYSLVYISYVINSLTVESIIYIQMITGAVAFFSASIAVKRLIPLPWHITKKT